MVRGSETNSQQRVAISPPLISKEFMMKWRMRREAIDGTARGHAARGERRNQRRHFVSELFNKRTFGRKNLIFSSILIAVSLAAISYFGTKGSNPNSSDVSSTEGNLDPKAYEVQILRSIPHDVRAFTEGLLFSDNFLIESTGNTGESSLRLIAPEDGLNRTLLPLPNTVFGEGIAIIDDVIYQLTWHDKVVFKYRLSPGGKIDALPSVPYPLKEGWGLTSDGRTLYASDGSDQIYKLDKDSMAVGEVLRVTFNGQPVSQLNELEWIDGKIYANVWLTDRILMINPKSGQVTGYFELPSGIAIGPGAAAALGPDDVLNGIAWDPKGGRLFLTGKRWPLILEVQLSPHH